MRGSPYPTAGSPSSPAPESIAGGDRPFARNGADYRVIPVDADDVVMSHISTNYDRTGFQADLNVIFPMDPAARDGG